MFAATDSSLTTSRSTGCSSGPERSRARDAQHDPIAGPVADDGADERDADDDERRDEPAGRAQRDHRADDVGRQPETAGDGDRQEHGVALVDGHLVVERQLAIAQVAQQDRRHARDGDQRQQDDEGRPRRCPRRTGPELERQVAVLGDVAARRGDRAAARRRTARRVRPRAGRSPGRSSRTAASAARTASCHRAATCGSDRSSSGAMDAAARAPHRGAPPGRSSGHDGIIDMLRKEDAQRRRAWQGSRLLAGSLRRVLGKADREDVVAFAAHTAPAQVTSRPVPPTRSPCHPVPRSEAPGAARPGSRICQTRRTSSPDPTNV